MSDSESGFGGFSKTTPDTKKLPTRIGNATAGHSRTAAVTNGKRRLERSESDDDVREVQAVKGAKNGTPASKRKRTRTEVVWDKDAARKPTTRPKAYGKQAVEDNEQSEEAQEIDGPPSEKPRNASKEPAPGEASGNASKETIKAAAPARAKGKEKPWQTNAKPLSSKQPPDDVPEAVHSNGEDEEEHEGWVVELADAITKIRRLKKSTTRLPRKEQSDEVTHLKEQLEQANTHIQELKRQLEELHQIRVTESELLLKRMETQYEADRQAHEQLVEGMQKQLQRKDPLLRPNKKSVFELLTRDEADKEMQCLKEQAKKYKEAIRERDQSSKQKDDKIKELYSKMEALKMELQMEIGRGKQFIAKANQQPPNSAQKPQSGRSTGISGSPQIRELTKFYEDLTNIAVLSIQPQKSKYFDLEGWVLLCVYTSQGLINPDIPTKELTFNLRLCWDPISGLEGKPKSEADLVDSVHFLPLDLEKESKGFVESLRSLQNPMTFKRTRLSQFLRELDETL